MAGLRAEIEGLYRAGMDRSPLSQWCAAHDLVARFVAPATGSAWAREARACGEAEDLRPLIDRVLPDEFPLSTFYVSLRARLAPVLELARAAAPKRKALAA